MKFLAWIAALALPLAVFVIPRALAQNESAASLKHLTATPLNARFPARLAALSIERDPAYPGMVRLRGNVEIKSPVCLPVGPKSATVCDGETIVSADEADFDEKTGEIAARGSVHVTPLFHEPGYRPRTVK